MSTAYPPVRSGFIAGPISDSVFLIGAPLVAVAVYLPFHTIDWLQVPLPSATWFAGQTAAQAFLDVVIFSHLFLVFFRSHLNPEIFRLHRWRFTVVPLALLLALLTSPVALAITGAVAVYWDVYHSSLQTFGIGRIYDLRQGNDLQQGRRLDYWLNLVLYMGPIVGGTSLLLHVMLHQRHLSSVPELQAAVFDWTPATRHRWLTYGMLGCGAAFCLYYLYAYRRFARQGYRVSLQKVLLLVTLAVVSCVCWGFNSFGEAFFVMNFFHAWQYFFIVWFMERKQLTRTFRLGGWTYGRQVALALFLLLGIGFGVWIASSWPAVRFSQRSMMSILLVVSIMHFWYDGFIWSVRSGQVR